MPDTPLRACSYPMCSTYTRHGRCPAHVVVKPWKPPAAPRVRGRRLQTIRALLFSQQPLCRICEANGRTEPAVIRDHIRPLAEGGTDAEENIQPLCQDCSDAKTRQETTRGKARWRAKRRTGGVSSTVNAPSGNPR